jgi:hypothetical protein
MGLLLGTPLRRHHIVPNHTYHIPSLFPPKSLSLGILGCIDPRRGCPLFYGKKALKAQRDWCMVKDKIISIKLLDASPGDHPRKKWNTYLWVKGDPQ